MSIASSCCVVPTLLPNGITVFALKCLEERRVKSRRVGEQRRNHRQTRMLLKIIPKPLRRQKQKNKSLRCRSERFNAFCYYEPRRNHWPYFSFLTDARQTAQDYNSLRKKVHFGHQWKPLPSEEGSAYSIIFAGDITHGKQEMFASLSVPTLYVTVSMPTFSFLLPEPHLFSRTPLRCTSISTMTCARTV